MVAHVNGNRRKVYKTYKVVAVGDSAFLNCYDLTSVTIPESVTSIGGPLILLLHKPVVCRYSQFGDKHWL